LREATIEIDHSITDFISHGPESEGCNGKNKCSEVKFCCSLLFLFRRYHKPL